MRGAYSRFILAEETHHGFSLLPDRCFFLVTMNGDIDMMRGRECLKPEQLLTCVGCFVRLPPLKLGCLVVEHQGGRYPALSHVVQSVWPHTKGVQSVGEEWQLHIGGTSGQAMPLRSPSLGGAAMTRTSRLCG